MTIIITFSVSFLGLSFLFLSKHREIKTGEKSFLGKVLAKFDTKSSSFLFALHYRIYQIIQTIRFIILVRLPEKGKVRISKTRESVVNGYNKQKDVIMGKKELSGNGSSSFFLRKMSENKNNNGNGGEERGRIEDDSIEELKS